MGSARLFVLLAALVGLAVLSACGSAPPPTATPEPEPTPVVETAAPESGLSRFVIVPEESQASYIVDEEFFADALSKYGISAGRVDTVGTTQEVSGEIQLDIQDPASLGPSRFTVNLESLTSDQSLRDGWIRNNALESSTYPTAEFVVTGIENAPETYTEGQEATFTLRGDMTIRDITQPVAFDVTATLADDTVTGTATAQLRMTDFGVEPPSFANTLTVKDEFVVEIEFVARRQ